MSQNVKYLVCFSCFIGPIVLAVVVFHCFGEIDDENIWNGLKSQFYNPPHPRSFMTTPQIIVSLGYPVEEHKVTTKDGYILTLFRIPRGKNGRPKWRTRPVIIQHGMVSSSADWLFLAQDSLPLKMADDGHEIWLTNTRGNHYSLEHQTMHQDDLKFWDFSYDEMAKEDVPTMISYILDISGADRVNWIGHSMGCSVLFMAMDLDPSLNSKVNKMTSLAPAVYSSNMISPPHKLATYFPTSFLRKYFDYMNGGRFLSPRLDNFVKAYGPHFCSGRLTVEFCQALLFFNVGFNREQSTEKTVMWLVGHAPSQFSAKAVTHFWQLVGTGKFQAYDHGEAGNLEKHGSPTPPLYNLTKVTVPVQTFYGLNDWIVTPGDVELTLSQLGKGNGNVAKSILVDHVSWNHVDFVVGKSAPVLIYERILTFMAS